MKRFLKKRWLGIPVGVIAGIIVTTSIVLAAVLISIPSHVDITPAPEPDAWDIGVYSDAECQNPVTFIEWGQIEVLTTAEQTVYIQNEGNVTAVVTVSCTIGAPLVTFEASPLTLLARESGPCTLTLTAGNIPGDISSWTTNFESDPQP